MTCGFAGVFRKIICGFQKSATFFGGVGLAAGGLREAFGKALLEVSFIFVGPGFFGVEEVEGAVDELRGLRVAGEQELALGSLFGLRIGGDAYEGKYQEKGWFGGRASASCWLTNRLPKVNRHPVA